MHNVRNCDIYINSPSSRIFWCFVLTDLPVLHVEKCNPVNGDPEVVVWWNVRWFRPLFVYEIYVQTPRINNCIKNWIFENIEIHSISIVKLAEIAVVASVCETIYVTGGNKYWNIIYQIIKYYLKPNTI
jgi:hypothetical protein